MSLLLSPNFRKRAAAVHQQRTERRTFQCGYVYAEPKLWDVKATITAAINLINSKTGSRIRFPVSDMQKNECEISIDSALFSSAQRIEVVTGSLL